MEDYTKTLQENMHFVHAQQHNMAFSDNYFSYNVEAAMYQDMLDRFQDTVYIARNLADEVTRLEELLKERPL